MSDLRICVGVPAHADFLREMLYEAAYWRSADDRPPLAEALARPDLARILADWGNRPGDAAVIAVDGDGRPLGAAWYRFWTAAHHSYGYVDEATPEVGLAVVPGERGRGIGAGLLSALVNHARQQGIGRLSLSVEQDNPAVRLYERAGFRQVILNGNAWTMVVQL
jgi:GNAT superfamily N-acetyltransferase